MHPFSHKRWCCIGVKSEAPASSVCPAVNSHWLEISCCLSYRVSAALLTARGYCPLVIVSFVDCIPLSRRAKDPHVSQSCCCCTLICFTSSSLCRRPSLFLLLFQLQPSPNMDDASFYANQGSEYPPIAARLRSHPHQWKPVGRLGLDLYPPASRACYCHCSCGCLARRAVWCSAEAANLANGEGRRGAGTPA